MKPIWSGSLSFGLVSIPVKLYPATQEHVLGFKNLCKTCKKPIRMLRWCEHCNKEVVWDNVVKGLPLERGKYLVLTKEAIQTLKPKKTTQLLIQEFVLRDLIDPRYINTHYYVAPTNSQRAYALLNYALGASQKVAIGSFVMRDKEHLAMVQSHHEGLLLSTLFYAYEIKSPVDIMAFDEKLPSITSQELKLAQTLINQLTKKTFDLGDYKENFAQELKALIKKRKKGVVAAAEKPAKGKRPKTAPSLIQMLRESLREEGAVQRRHR